MKKHNLQNKVIKEINEIYNKNKNVNHLISKLNNYISMMFFYDKIDNDADKIYISQYVMFKTYLKYPEIFSLEWFNHRYVNSSNNRNIINSIKRKSNFEKLDTEVSNNNLGLITNNYFFYIHDDFCSIYEKITTDDIKKIEVNFNYYNNYFKEKKELNFTLNYKYIFMYSEYYGRERIRTPLYLLDKAFSYVFESNETSPRKESSILYCIKKENEISFMNYVGIIYSTIGCSNKDIFSNAFSYFDVFRSLFKDNKQLYWLFRSYKNKYTFMKTFVDKNGNSLFYETLGKKLLDVINVKYVYPTVIPDYIYFLGKDVLKNCGINNIEIYKDNHFVSSCLETFPETIHYFNKDKINSVSTRNYRWILYKLNRSNKKQSSTNIIRAILDNINSKRRLNAIFKGNEKLKLNLL